MRKIEKEVIKARSTTAELLEFITERGIVRSRDFPHRSNARSALNRLLQSGQVEKVRYGVYQIPGQPQTDVQIARSHPMGHRQKMILQLLAKPHTAAELRAEAGISRQAIDQTLKKLMKEGFVQRSPLNDEASAWLYIRSGEPEIEVQDFRPPALTRVEQELLCLLPPEGYVKRSAIRARLGSGAYSAIQRLSSKGMVDEIVFSNRKSVRITRKGSEHPAYEPNCEHLARVGVHDVLSPPLITLMLALDVLEQARAIDLTDASRVGPMKRSGTGQFLQRLRLLGYIEQSKVAGHAPIYRLTERGRSAIASAKAAGNAISTVEARKRIGSAREARASLKARSFDGTQDHSGHLYWIRKPKFGSIEN